MRDRGRAAGPDTIAFLQGQLSQDVASLAVGERALSFLLEPAGKVVCLLGVTRTGDEECVLDTDAGFGQAMLDRLSRFKLRTKCEITPLPPAPVELPWRDEADRVARGLPSSADLAGAIPNEAGGATIAAAVSFTKGCYTGQELVARVDSRGNNVPRPLRRVAAAPMRTLPVGATIAVGGADVGIVTSAADGVGLGRVVRSVVPPASGSARWDGGQCDVTVEDLPE